MDPFIESQTWEDFHHTAISVNRELLAIQVADQVVVNFEERVHVEDAEKPTSKTSGWPPVSADEESWLKSIVGSVDSKSRDV